MDRCREVICGYCGKRGHHYEVCNARRYEECWREVVCNYCGRREHYLEDCRGRIRDEERRREHEAQNGFRRNYGRWEQGGQDQGGQQQREQGQRGFNNQDQSYNNFSGNQNGRERFDKPSYRGYENVRNFPNRNYNNHGVNNQGHTGLSYTNNVANRYNHVYENNRNSYHNVDNQRENVKDRGGIKENQDAQKHLTSQGARYSEGPGAMNAEPNQQQNKRNIQGNTQNGTRP